MTQRDHLELVAGLGIATANGGAVKRWRLGQICVGANTCVKKYVNTLDCGAGPEPGRHLA